MDTLAIVARALHDEPTPALVLESTCRAAALGTVPGCAHAEVTGPRGEVLAAAGPRSPHAAPTGLAAEACARRALASSEDGRHLAVPLWFDDTTVGVLGLTASSAFDDADVAIASALGTHAALACARALASQRLEHVQTALQTNRGIGIAIGIVMSRQHLSQEAAFEVLRAASQHENRKLRDVAADVVLTGELPGPALVSPGARRAGRR